MSHKILKVLQNKSLSQYEDIYLFIYCWYTSFLFIDINEQKPT